MSSANHRGHSRIGGVTRPGKSRLIQLAIDSHLSLPAAHRHGLILIDLHGALFDAVLASVAPPDRKFSMSKVLAQRSVRDKRKRHFQGGSDG